MRQIAGGVTEECSATTNIRLTPEQFSDKMLSVPNGKALVDLLVAGEIKIAQNLGLINWVEENGQKFFFIPRWNNFISHLQICHSVFSKEE